MMLSNLVSFIVFQCIACLQEQFMVAVYLFRQQ